MKKQFLYLVRGATLPYSKNANAYQKLALVAGMENGWIVVPPGYRGFVRDAFGEKVVEADEPRLDAATAIRCLPVSNEVTMLSALWGRIVHGRRYVAFCWDPPGIMRRDSRRLFDRFRCRVMDFLMERVIRHSEGLALNLHPGFLEGRLSDAARRKVRAFPNGTQVAANRRAADGVTRHPKRIGISSVFSEVKGCWEVVEMIRRLWSHDEETEFVWIGGGPAFEAVRTRLRELGCEGPRMLLLPGGMPLEESMRLQASCSIAVCLYRDVPSLRWNYVLKASEALSLGLPMVAFRLPGIAEYVREGETGALLADGDVDGVVEKVSSFLNDADGLRRMREACLSRAECYDWAKVNDEIRAFMEEAAT